MAGARNFVAVLVTLYLLAIMGALAYAALRALIAKRGVAYFFHARTQHGFTGARHLLEARAPRR